jgi:hypothetical protein
LVLSSPQTDACSGSHGGVVLQSRPRPTCAPATCGWPHVLLHHPCCPGMHALPSAPMMHCRRAAKRMRAGAGAGDVVVETWWWSHLPITLNGTRPLHHAAHQHVKRVRMGMGAAWALFQRCCWAVRRWLPAAHAILCAPRQRTLHGSLRRHMFWAGFSALQGRDTQWSSGGGGVHVTTQTRVLCLGACCWTRVMSAW